MAKADTDRKVVAQNRRARFDYFIEDTVEAGIMLVGTEVKSLRSGKASILESYAGDQNGELFLVNAYIPEYGQAGQFFQHEPKRPRKLLVRKRELVRMLSAIQREGMTLIPMSIYFNDRGKAKVELALARGKKLYDKRAALKEKDSNREMERTLRRDD